MTSTQFIEKFRLLTEVVSSYESPGLLDSEICDLLNTAQREITLELCTSNKLDSLYSLIVEEGITLTPEGNGSMGGPLGIPNTTYKGSFSGNLFYPVSGQIAVSRAAMPSTGFIPSYSTANTIVPLDAISPETGKNFTRNTINNNTIFLYPKYWIEGNGLNNTAVLKVIIDKYTTVGSFTMISSQPHVVFTYVKVPQNINSDTNTTSDLPENLHEVILKRAVDVRNVSLTANINKN